MVSRIKEGLRRSAPVQALERVNARLSLIKPTPDESVKHIAEGNREFAERSADVYRQLGEQGVRTVPGSFYEDYRGRLGRRISLRQTHTVLLKRVPRGA
jgi:hypothetical protein